MLYVADQHDVYVYVYVYVALAISQTVMRLTSGE
jgi:hypothetical protein